jgi:DNA-directed RNA polymerase subunit RPC12/RpoP
LKSATLVASYLQQGNKAMAAAENNSENPGLSTVTPRDILFECPSCGKSLVVDEQAQGLIIDCPQCHINVIVPPKPHFAIAPPSSSAATSRITGEPKSPAATSKAGASGSASVQDRLAALGSQLRELQTQRTEISNRLASRLNELNRDLVMLARLETTQQQVLSEWSQLITQLPVSSAQSTVLGASERSSGRSRVQFGG